MKLHSLNSKALFNTVQVLMQFELQMEVLRARWQAPDAAGSNAEPAADAHQKPGPLGAV